VVAIRPIVETLQTEQFVEVSASVGVGLDYVKRRPLGIDHQLASGRASTRSPERFSIGPWPMKHSLALSKTFSNACPTAINEPARRPLALELGLARRRSSLTQVPRMDGYSGSTCMSPRDGLAL
jgi:hypothetical protein